MAKMASISGQIKAAMEAPYTTNLNIIFETSELCRELAGISCVLCKSGKDRTAQGVSFEQARGLATEGALVHFRKHCALMRSHGVRRYNVYANTGQSRYAFSNTQRSFFPSCLRAPKDSCTNNVAS